MDDLIDVGTEKEDRGLMTFTLYQGGADSEQLHVTAVDSRSFTKAVVTTGVQRRTTIGHGAP